MNICILSEACYTQRISTFTCFLTFSQFSWVLISVILLSGEGLLDLSSEGLPNLSGERLLDLSREAFLDVCHMHGIKHFNIPAQKTNKL